MVQKIIETIEIEKFITKDGQTFDSETAARTYENTSFFTNQVFHDIRSSDKVRQRATEAVIKRFDKIISHFASDDFFRDKMRAIIAGYVEQPSDEMQDMISVSNAATIANLETAKDAEGNAGGVSEQGPSENADSAKAMDDADKTGQTGETGAIEGDQPMINGKPKIGIAEKVTELKAIRENGYSVNGDVLSMLIKEEKVAKIGVDSTNVPKYSVTKRGKGLLAVATRHIKEA